MSNVYWLGLISSGLNYYWGGNAWGLILIVLFFSGCLDLFDVLIKEANKPIMQDEEFIHEFEID